MGQSAQSLKTSSELPKASSNKSGSPTSSAIRKSSSEDITEGRYTTVFSPLDESEIYVTDSAGAQKQPAHLSRGAREQLFLSLRFGLIREHGQHAERLPVIVDEVLVNFDPGRALKAAHAFIELSHTNQVLVFTCHPQIVDWFVSAALDRGAQPPEIIEIGETVSQGGSSS